MARRGVRSLSVPITFGAVTVPLSVFLLVGWTTFATRSITDRGELASQAWLVVVGVISLLVITSVLVMFSIFLAREILEVRRQDGFIDSVTHELKTPLASIKLCLQTLEREGLPVDTRAKLQKMMHDDVDRLATFIDDVLQASRLSHGDVGMAVEEVELAALASHCAEVVATRHRLAPGRIEVAIDPALVVSTDAAALEIVLRNLLDNAVKYSNEEPSVRVDARVSPDGERVEVSVTDHGIGIARQDLKRIFQRFYRVATEPVRARKGTGLGLFVVSALVRNLGGTASAESRGLGHGATMRVSLPRHGPDPKAAARRRAALERGEAA